MQKFKSKIQSAIKDPSLRFFETSFNQVGPSSLMMIRIDQDDFLMIDQGSSLYQDLMGEEVADQLKKCPTDHVNRLVLNEYFDFTKPQAFGKNVATIGLGD